MIPAERRARLLQHLKAEGAVSVQRLAESLQASASTIRRDLEELEQAGVLVRSHGGALVREPSLVGFEPARALAAAQARAEKRAIGRAVAAMLEPGQSLILDSSSTVLAVAQALLERPVPDLTIVTNDLETAGLLNPSASAGLLAEAPQRMRVILTGGTLRPGSQTLLGEPGLSFVSGLTVDLALIGVHAISGEACSDTSLELAETKRAFIRAGRRVLILADSSKFTASAFCRVAPLSAAEAIVTDTGLDPRIAAGLAKSGHRILQVAPDPTP